MYNAPISTLKVYLEKNEARIKELKQELERSLQRCDDQKIELGDLMAASKDIKAGIDKLSEIAAVS